MGTKPATIVVGPPAFFGSSSSQYRLVSCGGATTSAPFPLAGLDTFGVVLDRFQTQNPPPPKTPRRRSTKIPTPIHNPDFLLAGSTSGGFGVTLGTVTLDAIPADSTIVAAAVSVDGRGITGC